MLECWLHSVKIAALETFELLLNVGGSLRTDHWRAKVDLLLINIARTAWDSGVGYEQKICSVSEKCISDFQLSSSKALLASFLSPHARLPYLAQRIELFRKGKLEIGTRLAEFCSDALLALDVLTHPRALSLERAGPLGPGLDCGAPEKAVFGASKFKFSPSGGQGQVMEDEDMYDDWFTSTKDDEPTAAKMLHDGKQSTLVKDPQIDSHRIPEAVQHVPTSNKRDSHMVDVATEETFELNTVDNSSSSNAVSTSIYTTPLETQQPAVAPVFEEKRTDNVDRLQNKSSAVDEPSSNPGTSGEAPADLGVASSSCKAPEGSSTRFAQPSKPDLSDAESEDSIADIVDR